MPKLVLARGDITATDELVIILNQSDNEPAAVCSSTGLQQPPWRPLQRSRPQLARSPQ
jgi:hypothetical protein